MVAGTAFGLLAICAAVGLLSLSGWFLSATAFAGLSPAAAKAFNYFFPSVGVRFFAISRTLTRYLERVLSHDATFRLLASLRVWFYERIEPLSPARLMAFRSGDILNRITADIDSLDNLYLRVLSPSIVAALAGCLVAAFLWFYAPAAAVVCWMAMAAAGILVPAVAMGLAAETGREITRSMGLFRARIVEGIQGMAELLLFGSDDAYLDSLRRHHRSLISHQGRMSMIRGAAGASITLIAGGAAWLTLYLCVQRVSRGDLHGTHMVMITLAVLAVFEAVTQLPSAYQFLGQTHEAAKRVSDIVDTEPAVAFPAATTLRPTTFEICFNQVHFTYGSETPRVLEGIDFTVAPGNRMAIIGQTGAGKSTLVHLLVRSWDPTSGRILIGGEDIRNFCESDLRRSVTVVPQTPHMFSGSIRHNLQIAAPEAPDDHLWDALSSVNLAEFVQGLPAGLDTWIGEAGRLVSGGQARRIALARAVLHDSPIWVLDEPTEGLDPVNERRIMTHLQEVTRGKTVLIITHRLVAMESMDGIILMERGRVIAQGTHDTLLRTSSRYRSLHARILP
jgi:ATP-binding cassette subfamily C protein CydC